MRRMLTALLAAVVMSALAAGAEEKDPFVAAADGMKKELGDGFLIERTGIFVVAGDLTKAQFDRFKKHTIGDCADALWKDFFTTKPDYPIRVYLFADKDSYEKWVPKLAGFKPHTPYGFYLPDRQALMMNIATGGGTLVHEMTHALCAADFPDCPTWFFEGLGSLFEQCGVTADGHIKGYVNWRLPILQKGGCFSLETLIKTTNADFRGEKEPLNYANARYLCLYLQEQGLLTKFYAAFRDALKAGTDKTGWDTFKTTIGRPVADFEKDWQAWVKALK